MKTDALRFLHDAEGPFVSVLLDVSHDTENGETEHGLRVDAALADLAEAGAPEELVALVSEPLRELVHRPSPVGRVVVANAGGVLLDDLVSARVDRPVASYGPLPDVTAWIAHKDATTRFVLALVDHVGADVALYDADVPHALTQEQAGGETLHAHKVPTGAWAALKVQHVSENVWARNAADAAAQVRGMVAAGTELVIVGGDPRSRSLVRDELSGTTAEVVELESGGRAEDGGDEARDTEVRAVLVAQAARRRTTALHELRDRLGEGGRAAAGVDQVLDAFVRGQVQTLLIDPEAAAEVTVDPASHRGLALGTSTPLGEVRADQVLVAAAARTDADVVVVPQGGVPGQPVGALLRWSDRTGDQA